tara:strand:- start:4704 stop:5123 length:420 start_codon:yes stop_codon:yes gene_type:complete
MKLYLKDIQNINTKKIIQYKLSTTKQIKLFSHEGIFIIEANKYKKENVVEGEIKDITYDSVDLVMDMSTIVYEIENKIPYNHIHKEYTSELYHLRKSAIVGFRVIYLEGHIVDAYFESKYKHDDFAVKEDVLSFVRLLN